MTHKGDAVTHGPDFQEYPKMLYRLGDAARQLTVHSAAEEEAAGSLWYDEILGVPDQEPEVAPTPAPDPAA